MIPISRSPVVPPIVIRRYVEYCIPEDLIPSSWKCTDEDPIKNLENLLRLSNGKLDEYASNVGVLFTNLMSYTTFPGSWAFFKFPKTVLYTNHVSFCPSLGKRSFAYKRDLYPLLQSCIKTVPLSKLESMIAMSIVAYFLKTHEEKINISEMTEASPAMFAALKTEIDNLGHSFISGEWKRQAPEGMNFNRMSLEEATEKFTIILESMFFEEGSSDEIVELLKKYSEKLPLKNNGQSYLKILTWLGMLLARIKAFIDFRPHMFKPSKAVLKPTPGCKVIVRLIHLKTKQVVLVDELYERMKMGGLNVAGLEEMVQGMSEIATFTLREIFEMSPPHVMKNVEFVCIRESRRIPVINGDYVIANDDELRRYANGSEDDVIAATNSNEKSGKNSEKVIEKTTEEKKEEESKKKKAMKNQKKQKITSQDPVPTVKESESCPKCFRASSFTREANEKLKLEKIETKQLRKRLTELEMENLTKDEKVQSLAMLVEMQKKELEEKDEMIRSQKEHLEEVQMQLKSKAEMVEDLQAAISLAPVPAIVPEQVIPTRSNEEAEKVRDVLFTLLRIQATLDRESPIPSALRMTNELMRKTNCAEDRKRSRFETILYRESMTKYIEAVESNLAMIRENQQITADQIPKLPIMPTLSQWFQDTYKAVAKPADSPEADPNELSDMECLICFENMSRDETKKCECCRRRYHKDCIQKWFQTNRICPTCRTGMLDAKEYPDLPRK